MARTASPVKASLMLHIACIDNIAAAGFHLLAPRWPVTWHYGPPSAVYQSVRLGACDAALLPVGGYAELAGVLEPIGRFGIGCHGSVHSVQVFSRLPLHSMIKNRQSFFATPESKTSRKLFTTLCQLEYGTAPCLASEAAAAEGMLLIGGEALRHSRLQPGWPYHRDLGQWWHERTRLPFVFARWVVNRGLSGEDRQKVLDWLSTSTAHCETDAGRAALQERVVSDGFPASLAAPYYQRIQYALSAEHVAGERLFLSLQDERGLCPASA